MKKRFCTTERGKWICQVGWGSVGCTSNGKSEFKSCFDEPMEQNCRMVVDEEDKPKISICPCCGTAIDTEEEPNEEHLFFNHIRELIRDLKRTSK